VLAPANHFLVPANILKKRWE